jgi:uncharacterized protein YdbL (DUF1318 family)
MKKHKKQLTVIVSMMLCVFACVTVNIYFPAEKVEEFAEDFVSDVRGGGEGEEAEEPPKDDKTSLLQRTMVALTCSTAWAEDATAVSNATIRALKKQMGNRDAQLRPYYQQGRLIEGNDGYLSQGNTEGLNLKERRNLKNLVDAENNDRRRLYSEVAKAMEIDPSQVNRIAEIFAEEWKANQ